ncbi:MAG: Gfo/Idh/MocA family oxidoreductase [Planctomycetales bacterium]|nr:Gfo/Idh/MocA family oxidoreductase [Planctomycetales bacterium]
MSEKVCRWGILGTAGIARKNWAAIHLSGNGRVVAVASRNAQAAAEFIDGCSAEVPQAARPDALGSYEDLLAREDIDAVYIPLPTAVRHEWVIRAARAGKHVVGEKPAALNATQLSEMLDACQQHGVQYMDGVMFMHSQRLPLVRSLLDDSEPVGKLRRMVAHFSFAGDEAFCRSNIRVDSDLEPYGCLGDLGWYCIRFFLWAMQGQLPREVRGQVLSELQGQSSPRTVPGEFSAELLFAEGVSASFYCSFVTENQQWVHASGSRGYLQINDFVLPYHGPEVAVLSGQDKYCIENCSFHMEQHAARHAIREYDAGHHTAQEVRMFRHFAQLVLSGERREEWPRWTLDTQRVLDACFHSAQQDGAAVKL